jgi:hypothetical protein
MCAESKEVAQELSESAKLAEIQVLCDLYVGNIVEFGIRVLDHLAALQDHICALEKENAELRAGEEL